MTIETQNGKRIYNLVIGEIPDLHAIAAEAMAQPVEITFSDGQGPSTSAALARRGVIEFMLEEVIKGLQITLEEVSVEDE